MEIVVVMEEEMVEGKDREREEAGDGGARQGGLDGSNAGDGKERVCVKET